MVFAANRMEEPFLICSRSYHDPLTTARGSDTALKKDVLTHIRAAQHNRIQVSQTFESVEQVRVNHGLELIYPPFCPA